MCFLFLFKIVVRVVVAIGKKTLFLIGNFDPFMICGQIIWWFSISILCCCHRYVCLTNYTNTFPNMNFIENNLSLTILIFVSMTISMATTSGWYWATLYYRQMCHKLLMDDIVFRYCYPFVKIILNSLFILRNSLFQVC